MTPADALDKLNRMFPRAADSLLEWGPGYRAALEDCDPKAIDRGITKLLAEWDKGIPPRPAEVSRAVAQAGHGDDNFERENRRVLDAHFARISAKNAAFYELSARLLASWMTGNAARLESLSPLGKWHIERIARQRAFVAAQKAEQHVAVTPKDWTDARERTISQQNLPGNDLAHWRTGRAGDAA